MTFPLMSVGSSNALHASPLGAPSSARPPAPLSLWRRDCTPNPVSGSMVAAVLAFGDVRRVREDGCTVISFSPERASAEDMRMLLGEDSEQVLELSVIWSETSHGGRSVKERSEGWAALRSPVVRPSIHPSLCGESPLALVGA